MSLSNKAILLEILGNVTKALEKNNITYFLSDGTLIGSYRHHGFIPWDEDADIHISIKHKSKALDVLWNISGIKYFNLETLQYKVHKENLLKPNLDVWFYSENVKYGLSPTGHSWIKDLVFPLNKRPFENLWLFAPRKTKAFLESRYPGFEKECIQMEHWKGLHIPRKACKIKCSELHAYIPFVFREMQIVQKNLTVSNQANQKSECLTISPNSSYFLPSKNTVQQLEILKKGNQIIQVCSILEKPTGQDEPAARIILGQRPPWPKIVPRVIREGIRNNWTKPKFVTQIT